MVQSGASRLQKAIDHTVILHCVSGSFAGRPVHICRVHRLNDLEIEIARQDEKVVHVGNQLGLPSMSDDPFGAFRSIYKVFDRRLDLRVELFAG
jgi:hypothetical protein